MVVLRGAVVGEGRIEGVEVVIDHRENDIEIPVTPVLTDHPRSHLRRRERRGGHHLAIGVHGLSEQVGHFRDLVAAELAPLDILGRIFLFARVITIFFLEQPDHFRMVAEIPFGIFPVLDDAVAGPQGGRQHHVDKAVVVDGNAVEAFHLAVSADLVVEVFTHLGQGRTEELVVVDVGRGVGEAASQAVHAEPFRMLRKYPAPVVLKIHRPEPGIDRDAVGLGDGNGLAVVVGGRGVEHHAVDACLVHSLADRFEVHIRTIVEPGPEKRVSGLGFLLSATGEAAQGRKGQEQVSETFHGFILRGYLLWAR